jgi:hypothetical protein
VQVCGLEKTAKSSFRVVFNLTRPARDKYDQFALRSRSIEIQTCDRPRRQTCARNSRSPGWTVTPGMSKDSTWKASSRPQSEFCRVPRICGSGHHSNTARFQQTDRVRRHAPCSDRNGTGLQLLAGNPDVK